MVEDLQIQICIGLRLEINNGLIIQFGTLSVDTVNAAWAGTRTHNLPISYPKQHFNCIVDNSTLWNANTGSTVQIDQRNLSNVVYRCFNTSANNLCYISLGN